MRKAHRPWNDKPDNNNEPLVMVMRRVPLAPPTFSESLTGPVGFIEARGELAGEHYPVDVSWNESRR